MVYREPQSIELLSGWRRENDRFGEIRIKFDFNLHLLRFLSPG